MNWTNLVTELIDFRSFSNLWFWIALAVLWSTSSHWVLGVPYDLIQRAYREDGQPMQDFRDILRVNVNRILYIARRSGLVMSGFVCFVLTSLGLMAFYYDVEFAQACFLLVLPMSIVGLLTINTAKLVEAEGMERETIFRRLRIHRVSVQFIGMLSIFVTAIFGMYQNLVLMY